MQRQPRQILVMRHAKAEQVADTDRERALAPRGRVEAAAAARWLQSHDITPDHALVSAATRTRQTFAVLAETAGWQLEPSYDAGLYSAGPDTVLDLVREIPPETRTLLVIGHNPTIGLVAQMLDDGDGDAAVGLEMAHGFSTSALAVLDVATEWSELAEGEARLSAYFSGRG